MKPIIIAGNGPSLAQIDYSRLPQDFDVFRCNQFYFEDKYFLGKKVKGAFFTSSLFYEQFFTAEKLKQNNEYIIEDIYCRHLYGRGERIRDKRRSETIEEVIMHDFPKVKSTYPYLKQMEDFHALLKFNMLYYGTNFTSGISMLITALAQGYKRIYLVGIDFYQKEDYVFQIKQTSNLHNYINYEIQPVMERQIDFENELDIQCIKLAKKMGGGVELYSISEKSPINKIIPLAPRQNNKNKTFVLKNKPKGYISDIITPPHPTRLAKIKRKLDKFGLKENNLFLVIIEDCVVLIKSFIKLFAHILRKRS